VSLRITAGESDAAAGAWPGGADQSGGPGLRAPVPAAVGPGAFGLALEKGLITAGVRARVSLHRTLAQWLQKPEGIALALTGRTALMVDSWNASAGHGSDPRSFEARVERGRRLPGLGEAFDMLEAAGRSAPAQALESGNGPGAEQAIDVLYAPIRALITGPLLAPVEPRGSLFRYHEIDVELIPEDRLGAP
jgi:hypothetical protein